MFLCALTETPLYAFHALIDTTFKPSRNSQTTYHLFFAILRPACKIARLQDLNNVGVGRLDLFSTADARKQELIEKYKQLKASGKLEKFLEKRRKKNAAKDHRYIPSSRRSAADD